MSDWPPAPEAAAVGLAAIAARMLGVRAKTLPPLRMLLKRLPVEIAMTIAMAFLAWAFTRASHLEGAQQILAVAFIVRGGPPLIDSFAARLWGRTGDMPPPPDNNGAI